MKTTELDFTFPETLIAQRPLARRDSSRLCVVERQSERISHLRFSDVVNFLKKGDLIVFNDTRVIPARLYGRKRTGARVEIFLLKKISAGLFEVLLKPRRRLPPGTTIDIAGDFAASVVRHGEMSSYVRLLTRGDIRAKINRFGRLPLPPYIKREALAADARRYQTIFARCEGASAAPTAGLHFTPKILKQLRDKGVRLAAVTLHVGFGTFQKIAAETIEEHSMHSERFVLTQKTVECVNRTKGSGGRVFAVGTTKIGRAHV